MSTSLLTEPGQHPVPRVEAPWMGLKAESYLLFVKLSTLPKGVYDRFEEAWGGEEMGKFEGGLGVVMIVRYSWTPVGAYDELLLIPGNFSVPQSSNTPPKIPRSALRIARIYVSQRTTVYNGRLNWNIPKHLARFSFSAPPTLAGQSPPASLRVQVFPPSSKDGDGVAPFFECTLKPWKWVPALPVNTKWVPLSLMQVQPPIPEPVGRLEAVNREIEGKFDAYDIETDEEALRLGTDRWTAYKTDVRAPRARGCWVSMGKAGGQDSGENENANEKYWPQGLQPWAIGSWCEEGVIDVLEPLEWKL
ncbi:hypothetical protein T440DRAFT_487492 [Plenodomus tracheiphilus IPT5]|uniref:Uncharacterized protein n=1 Tax=Plenodomus tracheiphilus IPT5 TaxID=1408161 RepID=A0A6A7BE60_9PLEO|nr:hypothetical protein T440DRAFT_487492 [Plenodomus tracheiphilus IPT5]